jgi:hypothetical protein
MAALKCQNVTTRESTYKTSENVYARKLKLTPDGGFCMISAPLEASQSKFTYECKANHEKVMIKMKAVKDSEYE